MDLAAINELDFNESGEWPLPAKIVSIVLVCLLVWGLGYFFVIKDKQAELENLEQKEVELRQSFEIKQAKAINLAAYKAQLAEMRVMFAGMLEQLPRKNEVADLLVDITRTGLVNGLEFELFRPESERPIDFYAELPISITVTGRYHQFGEFISGVAALPRIVTLHNLKMGPPSENDGLMQMEITAKTYRYFEGEGE